jgi:hypothetical protein
MCTEGPSPRWQSVVIWFTIETKTAFPP